MLTLVEGTDGAGRAAWFAVDAGGQVFDWRRGPGAFEEVAQTVAEAAAERTVVAPTGHVSTRVREDARGVLHGWLAGVMHASPDGGADWRPSDLVFRCG